MENLVYRKCQNEYAMEKKLLSEKAAKYRFCQKQGFPLWERICGNYELSENEKRLNECMERFRTAERAASCERDEKKTYPAAMPFYSAKEYIANSPLFKMFRKMPKGALLHVHSSAALSSEGLRALLGDWNIQYPAQRNIRESPEHALYVLWSDPVPEKWQKGTLFYQWFLDRYQEADLDQLFASCVPLGEVLEINAFWEMLAFTDHVEKNPSRWEELNAMFSRTSNLLEDKEFYRLYHKWFFRECIDDKIDYVEMRSGLASFHDDISNADFQPVLAHHSYDWRRHFYFQEMNALNGVQDTRFMDILQDELVKVQQSEEGRNFNLRLILNARRNLDPAKPAECVKLLDKLNSAILFHNGKNYKKYHDFVIGFDFVSEEDRGCSTEAYHELIYGSALQMPDTESAEAWKSLFLDNQIGGNQPRIQLIDFFLHDGESTWSNNSNVVDACIASRYRIGHGFNLINHPVVAQTVSFGKDGCLSYFPMLELCPISNQLLMYYPDLRCHPALALMRQGIQCVICNDDPQMFGNGGLSYDFWMAYMGFGIDLLDIKRLVFNAYYARSGYTQKNMDAEFTAQWENFVSQALKDWRDPLKP